MVVSGALPYKTAMAHPCRLVFARNVRKEREKQGLTQEALAERSDTHVTYISDVERGVVNPSADSMGQIADGLGCRLSKLVP